MSGVYLDAVILRKLARNSWISATDNPAFNNRSNPRGAAVFWLVWMPWPPEAEEEEVSMWRAEGDGEREGRDDGGGTVAASASDASSAGESWSPMLQFT